MSELKESVQNLQERFAALKNLFDLDGKQKLVNDLESQTQASGFWNDQETAQGIAKKLGRLKEDVDAYVAVLTELQELVEFADLEDANLDDEIRKKAAALEKRVAALEELQMF
ncbi:MAG TPA: PCRF domain-containing protein, partial [bacterium]|nr:PCRF domain-containing protein [bacterium]